MDMRTLVNYLLTCFELFCAVPYLEETQYFHNQHLILFLSGNIGIEAKSRFLEPSFMSCFLTFLSLGLNKISDEGGCALARALQVNQSLQKLM